MEIDALLQALQAVYPDDTFEVQTLPLDEAVLAVSPERLLTVVAILLDRCGIYHLSTITGRGTESGVELLYHFWDGRGITLRVQLPEDDPVIETLTDRIPGAGFYEREVAEMLGVTFEGHPDPRPLLLPEDWDGAPPLR